MFIVIEKDYDELKDELSVRLHYVGEEYKSAQSIAHQRCKMVMESDLLPDGILFMGQDNGDNHRRLTSVYEVDDRIQTSTVLAHAKPKKLLANTKKPESHTFTTRTVTSASFTTKA